MNRLTEKIGLVLISSSLVLSGCTSQEEEIAERDSRLPDGQHSAARRMAGEEGLAERDDSLSDTGSGALAGSNSSSVPGSNFSNSSPYYHSSAPGFQHFRQQQQPAGHELLFQPQWRIAERVRAGRVRRIGPRRRH